ncbi:MAG: alpha/beta fold hydrolase, partial [Actinomycetota bacterium]|nr:alpha/beta fold hydrolase [Actinomycetota bacterium]
MTASVDQVIEQHRAAGRKFEAGGVRSFVREQGDGPAVLLLHGVPASSFLYRKVIPPLSEAGLRAIAIDFPGLGLAERPQDFDYSWSGLADWLEEAVDALGIERCHLVVHDLGGPIGCTWAVRNPDRVLSLTALNTVLDIA